MFTWEEAGLLRQLIHIVAWGVVLATLGGILFLERRPIASGLHAGRLRVQTALHGARRAG